MFVPKLGASLHCVWPEVTPEAIAALANSQIATLELFTMRFGVEVETAVSRLNGLFRTSAIRPMTIHSTFGGQYDLSSPDTATRERARTVLLEALDIATAVGAPMVVMHPSAEPIAAEDREVRRERALTLLSEIAPAYRQAGVRGALELLPRSCLGNTVDELHWFLDRLDPAVFGVCLDVNHAMNRYAALPDMVRALGARLITTHLSDYDGVDEKHWMPGRGVIDWRSLLQALSDIDYQGPFNYECQGEGDTPEQRVRSFEQNFAWLAGLLEARNA
jgi:sugar phosphate isomerase/epimerase